jgi:DNA repair exonuclease SbcCD ATPase subunit
MKSIYFLIPALIAIILSIGLSVNNRTTLKETRTERIKNNDLIVGVLNEIKQEDDPALTASYEALYAQEVRLAESKANTDTHNVNIKRLDNEISGLNSEKAPVDKKIATAENAVKEISERFPGTTLQNVAEKIKQLESDLETAKQDLATRKTELEVVNKKVAANEVRIEKAEKVQTDRLSSIGRNAAEGLITAVNTDWGFVLVNIGKDQGVQGDSQLIVQRDGIRIGNLNVVSIQPGLTVADINQKGLSGSVEPGDKVIFENIGE